MPWIFPHCFRTQKQLSRGVPVVKQNDVIKYSYSGPGVKSRKALLKIALHHRHFSKNLTTSSEYRYWKIHLDGYFWGQHFLRTFLNGCFSNEAAMIFHFKSSNGYMYFTFLTVTLCLRVAIFHGFCFRKRFGEKILFKNILV